MPERPNTNNERDLRAAASCLFLGAFLGLVAIGTGAATEELVFQDAPHTEAQILFGAVATIALALTSRKSFQVFWEEVRKPKVLEPPTGN